MAAGGHVVGGVVVAGILAVAAVVGVVVHDEPATDVERVAASAPETTTTTGRVATPAPTSTAATAAPTAPTSAVPSPAPVGPPASAPLDAPAPDPVVTTTTVRDTPASFPGDGTCAGTIVALVNRERTARDLPALVDDESITHVPLAWSDQMARLREMSHNPDYSEQIRVVHPDLAGWSENVGFYGGRDVTPAEVGSILVGLWMDSDGHRANILRASSTHTAVACSIGGGRTWATQNFWNR